MTATPTVREAAPARPRWQVLLIRPETMTFILLIAALFGASALSPYFLDAGYILDSFTLSAEFAMVALVIDRLVRMQGQRPVAAGVSG